MTRTRMISVGGRTERLRVAFEASADKTVIGDELKAMHEYVDRRNRIVHSGDIKPGRAATKPIRCVYVARAVAVAQAVGEAVSQVVAAARRRSRQ